MRRALAIALLAVGSTLACGGPAVEPPPRSDATDIPLTPDTAVIRGEVPRNSNLASMLTMHGLATDTVQQMVEAARGVFDPRRLRSSQPFSLERTLDGALRWFEYEIDADWFLRVIPVASDA